MEKDEIADKENQLFGDEELHDVIPDENQIEAVDYTQNPEKIGSVNWFNGRPVISFQSLCDKTKSIFTQVKGIPITVREAEDENYIYKSGEEFVINIAKKPIAGVTKYTAFNHELGHYAFDSFNAQFPEYIDDQLKMIPQEHHDKALELYRSVFNVIEDQRIESLMGDVYLGIGKRFRQMRKRLGSLKSKTHKTPNPLDALHCAREYRDGAIDKDFKMASNIMEDIELKDGEASILLAKEYIDKILNPWIIHQLQNCKNPFPESKAKPVNGQFKIDPNGDITCSAKLDGAFKQAFNDNRSSDHREIDNELTDEQRKQIQDALDKQKEGELAEALEQSEKNAEDKVGEIKDKIEENARKQKKSYMPDVKGIEHVNRTPCGWNNDPRPNTRISRNINKILKLLQSRNKPKIKDIGDELSVPAVIRRMARGYGDVMIKKVPRQKLAILVSIDASGSMDGNPIRNARDMMATLYKSIQGIEDIQLKAVIWAGGARDCLVSEVNSLRDCKTIHCNEYSGGTPTSYAVEYSERVIESMKAKKKLMIVITDGYPNSAYDGNLDAMQLVRREVNRARSKGIGTLGLMVGGSRDIYMDQMFGKDGYVTVDNMEQASNSVIKKFKQVVLAQAGAR